MNLNQNAQMHGFHFVTQVIYFMNLAYCISWWCAKFTMTSAALIWQLIGLLYSNMRSVQASLLEISCLQGFHKLIHVDPKEPLTSTNNSLLVINVVHLTYHIWDLSKLPFLRYRVYKLGVTTQHIYTHKHIHTHTGHWGQHDYKGLWLSSM